MWKARFADLVNSQRSAQILESLIFRPPKCLSRDSGGVFCALAMYGSQDIPSERNTGLLSVSKAIVISAPLSVSIRIIGHEVDAPANLYLHLALLLECSQTASQFHHLAESCHMLPRRLKLSHQGTIHDQAYHDKIVASEVANSLSEIRRCSLTRVSCSCCIWTRERSRPLTQSK